MLWRGELETKGDFAKSFHWGLFESVRLTCSERVFGRMLSFHLEEEIMDSVVIVSGGMDSVTLLHHLMKQEKRDPAVMTFQYGQKHSREIDCAKAQVALLGVKEHMIVDLRATQAIFGTSALVNEDIGIPDMQEVVGDNQPATYVPNRNMLFLAYAVAYAESLKVDRVFYGAQAHDLYGYWDTTPEFLERLNDVY